MGEKKKKAKKKVLIVENKIHMLKYTSTLWLAERCPDFEVSHFMPHSIIKIAAKIRNWDRNMLLYARMKSLFFSTVEWYVKPMDKIFLPALNNMGLCFETNRMWKQPWLCGFTATWLLFTPKKMWCAERLPTDISIRHNPSSTQRASLKGSVETNQNCASA